MSLIDAVRRPEYTGDRRCWPCTVVNGILLVVASAAVGLFSPLLAVALFAVGVAVVALRGYLFPYTPQFAPRLVAALPVAGERFGHAGLAADGGNEPTPGTLADDAVDGETVVAALLEAGVLGADDEALFLTDEAAARWETKMAALRDLSLDALGDAALAVSPTAERVETVSGDGDENEWIVLSDEAGTVESEVWLSPAVAIAEVAAERAFAEDVPDPAVRLAAAEPLRMFLTSCPACGGEVVETTTASCCGGPENTDGPQDVLACGACDAWLYEFPA